MSLDISPLERSVLQLQKSLNYFYSEMAEDEEVREQFRAATIQAFEYTQELSTKMIDRQLSKIVNNPEEFRKMDFIDRMREAADVGLIHDPMAYIRYRDLRNKTSHNYDVEQAEVTVAAIDGFLDSMRFLIKELTKRNS